jgi:hypothetical protein
MRRSNLAFCLAHTPHIAAQLEAASAEDRRALEKQIEGLSREVLMAADRLFGILTAGSGQTVAAELRFARIGERKVPAAARRGAAVR